MPTQNYKRRFKFSLAARIGLSLVFLVTIVLALSLAVRVTRGVSQTEPTPKHVVRLEILNGCSRAGIASEAARILSGYKNDELEIIVIETGDFDLTDVSKTMIISRDNDQTAAERLARLIGIDDAEVTYKPIGNNYRQISVTLVLGEDYHAAMLPKPSSRE
jgi:hypothetical protein